MARRLWILWVALAVSCSLKSCRITTSLENACIMQHLLRQYVDSAEHDVFRVSHMSQLIDAIAMGDRDVGDGNDYIAGESEGAICRNISVERELHQCTTGSRILAARGYNDNSARLNISQINELSPALLYQLVMMPCLQRQQRAAVPRHKEHANDTGDGDDLEIVQEEASSIGDVGAWVGSIGSVTLISVIGLAVIGIIPLIKRSLYDVVMQYLVALAVGTLVGDAMLHLIPHALGDESGHQEDGSESVHVWRGLVSLAGIALFFNAERLLGIITMQKNAKRAAEITGNKDRERSDSGSCVSGPTAAIVIGHSSNEMRVMVSTAHKKYHKKKAAAKLAPTRQVKPGESDPPPAVSAVRRMSRTDVKGPTHKVGDKRKTPKDARKRSNSSGSQNSSSNKVGVNRSSNAASPELVPDGDVDLATSNSHLTREEGAEHGHSHLTSEEGAEHGHSHQVPDSFSSVAYMVIMGDGLHNFTDGLTIGAAFASSLSGGMSTAVAVLCHELPHELGDFAMLLKSGMSVKQAFLCNLLSAALQMLGVLIGVAIGDAIGISGTRWLFAFAGGIFLYIGLVDMLPEIAKVEKDRPWKQLLLQNAGLTTGIGVMLLIGLYEHELETVFISAENTVHQH